MDRHSQRRLTARHAVCEAAVTASQASGPKAAGEGEVLQGQANDRDVEPTKGVRADRAPAPAQDRGRRDAEPAAVSPVVIRHRPVVDSKSTATARAIEEAPQSTRKEPKKVEWLAPAAVVIAAVITVLGGFRTTVKLMVLAFIVSLVSPVLASLRFSGTGGELKLNEVLSMVLVAGMLAFTVWRAPGFASDLLAASPSLGMSSVGQHITSAVSTGARVVGGAVSAGLTATRAAAGAMRGGSATSRDALKMVTSAAAAGARGQPSLAGAVGADAKGGAQGGAKGGAQGGKPASPTASKRPKGTA
jgi:hypothetical protein